MKQAMRTQKNRRIFDRLAEKDKDITQSVCDSFLASAPSARQFMVSVDERMRGRMLIQVMALWMADTESDYLEFEVGMHHGYGADSELYLKLFLALKQNLKVELLHDWSEEDEAVVNATIDGLLNDIKRLETA